MNDIPCIDTKSEWQKDNCINPKCNNPSKFELIYRNSRIRFCGNIDCLEVAKQLSHDGKIV